MKVTLENITLICILFVMGYPEEYEYRLMYGALFLLTIINFRKLLLTKYADLDAPALVLLSAWFYGFVLGIANGNGIDAIINFLGMIFLIGIQILSPENIKKDKIKFVILFAGAIQALYQFINFIAHFEERDFFLRKFAHISDFRSTYSVSTIFVIAAIVLLLYGRLSQFDRNKRRIRKWLSIFILVISVLLTGSKGYYASFLFSLAMPLVLTFNRKKILIYALIAPILFGASLQTTLYEILENSYSVSEAGNNLRSEQADAIRVEWTVIGKGLGSPLQSGYTRGDEDYGLELTYHSILHKFGYIFGLLIIGVYVYYIIVSMYYIRMGRVDACISLSLLSGTIPAYGNPTLFSPQMVCAVMLAILFLKYSRAKEV